MYFKKYQSHICFLLIISLLLCGMCFDNVQTDSSFVCSTFCETMSDADSMFDLLSFQHAFSAEQIYSQKIPEQREISAIIRQSVRINIIKMGRRNYHALWTAAIFPHYLFCILMYHANTAIHAVRSNTIILGYIHHKDGKKSHYFI